MANFPFFRFSYPNYYYHYYGNYNNANSKNSQLNLQKNSKTLALDRETSNKNNVQKNDVSGINTRNINNYYDDEDKNNQCCNQERTVKYKKTSSKYHSLGPIHFNNPFLQENLEEPIIEILGIELYLDDIIILGLLFFLYKEEVQDEMLFLVLILLLLT